MSYKIEGSDLVISGWEKGMSDDPYTGLSDMRNVNIISIPGEASVNFKTSQISYGTISGTMTNSSASNDTVSLSPSVGNLNGGNGIAIKFTVLSDATKGIALNTLYYLVLSGSDWKLYTDFALGAFAAITADGLTGTWSTYNMGAPTNFAYDSLAGDYYMVDNLGQVWTSRGTSQSPFFWRFTGNLGATGTSHGNGLVCFQSFDGTNKVNYLFVFGDNHIDYVVTDSTLTWHYNWKPSDGTKDAGTINIFNNNNNVSHYAMNGEAGFVYFCDGSFIESFVQTSPTTAFDPTNVATYTYTKIAVAIEYIDESTCLATLGTNLLIGAKMNQVYVWNQKTPVLYQYPIFLAENNVSRMITINTNTYIFAGNRGRIYRTNGSQAILYKKVPDHLSGTVEPYFTWGGVASIKNQLYFGVTATTNAGTTLTTYGGLWAIDTDTDAMRITNELSYGTYAGGALAIIPILTGNPAGTGLYVGWSNGTSYGIDKTVSDLYTTYVAYVDSDMIPISTYLKKRTFEQIEWKTTTPLVTGEGVKIQWRAHFSDTFTDIGESTTAGAFSDLYINTFENVQWIQLRVLLKSTATNPSYTRLKEIRIR